MKKTFALLAVFLMLFTLLSPAASANGYVPCTAFTGYINGYRINVRSGPGTNCAVIGIADCGEQICVSGCSGYGTRLWYYGKVGCLTGWVYGGYVSGAPCPIPAAVTPCTVSCTSGTIRLDASNFRSGPGLCYPSVLQLSLGTVVEIVGAAKDAYGSVWYQVLASGLTGWVRSDLVSVCAPSSCAPASGIAFTGYTNMNAVNVRSWPNGTRIAQVPRGTTVYVTGTVAVYGVCWYRISFWGTAAYIRADLVSPYGQGCGYACTPALIPACPGMGSTVPDTGSTSGIPGTGASGSFGTGASGIPGTGVSGSFGTDSAAGYNGAQGTVSGTDAAAVSAGHPSLSFTTFSFTPGQTLPVYTAPDTASLMADSGTAVMTVTGQVWVAGYDGQWLLVMYRNDAGMTRVGYVDAFRLQGTLPEVPALTLGGTAATVTARTALTSDPLEKTDTLAMLAAGESVTWLADLDMNGSWAYVEVSHDGAVARGFVPRTALK